MGKKWKCPNSSNFPNHPDTVLYSDDQVFTGNTNVDISSIFPRYGYVFPKPVKCRVCGKYYTKDECIEVQS